MGQPVGAIERGGGCEAGLEGGREVKPAIQKMVAARSWVTAARKPRSWMDVVEGEGSQCQDEEGEGEEVPLPTRLRLLEWWCEQDRGSGFSIAVG